MKKVKETYSLKKKTFITFRHNRSEESIKCQHCNFKFFYVTINKTVFYLFINIKNGWKNNKSKSTGKDVRKG